MTTARRLLCCIIIIMSKYVIDVTQLIHWSGNLTGIPRVMSELAIRFLKEYPERAVFVSWVKEVSAMCEIDFADTLSHRGDGITYRHTVSTPNNNITPPTVTARSKKIAKKIARKTGLDSSAFYQKVKCRLHQEAARSYLHYTPQPGDKLFIPWGEWWDVDWLRLMRTFHTEGVEIFPICHDILPMVVPQFSGNSASLQDFVKEVFPVSKAVLVPSKSTKRDLQHWMKEHQLNVPTIEVFRLGEDFAPAKSTKVEQAKVMKKYGVTPGDYIVFVSTIEPRKNHAILYYTYKLAKSRDITLPKLLIIGRVGHDTSEIINLFNKDPEINHLISLCHNVSDVELHALYDNCKFSVQPSFYEGWGMSVVESISKGKPVVCSNTSSLQEMPKEAIIFFNPASTDECLQGLIEMSKPSSLKEYTTAAKRYKLHSWDASFDQVLSVINGGKS